MQFLTKYSVIKHSHRKLNFNTVDYATFSLNSCGNSLQVKARRKSFPGAKNSPVVSFWNYYKPQSMLTRWLKIDRVSRLHRSSRIPVSLTYYLCSHQFVILISLRGTKNTRRFAPIKFPRMLELFSNNLGDNCKGVKVCRIVISTSL